MRFKGGAKGVLHASQICVGDENNLNIRVYGTKAGARVAPGAPERAHREISRPAAADLAPRQRLRRRPQAKRFTRIPAGHPEGYLEAFANIYREAFRAIAAEVAGKRLPPRPRFPTIDDGVEGMAFIETAVKSARLGAKWVKFPKW